MLTVFIRLLLLRGNALHLRRTTREHFDHFVGVDRGVCSATCVFVFVLVLRLPLDILQSHNGPWRLCTSCFGTSPSMVSR